ncbi:hypothetical protein Q670_07795 [Alcanivorax sp. P2S70]|uniref:Helix-turn-helix-type transcriptional regulator n=1 Tax=Alcanivorax profundi TaxID=2338368 RepID=A0A418Y1E2_9GAMM|nr:MULTISPECIES: MerR family transcriptional regulator [Alcanivorax]ERP92943.1 hypothetical protein Q670_07795 [Alcanivorax sp. P2S70]RJG19359.1 helix-turn-helix-type transcriptional regulator [Alcanivorax profundi]
MTAAESMPKPPLTIQGVSELCGVNAVTLRAWERRYGLIEPERTAKGHRRYNAAQVEKIQTIVQWLNKGVPIRQVRDLIDSQDHAFWSEVIPAGKVDGSRSNVWQAAHREVLAALQGLNGRRVEQCLNRLLRDYGHDAVISHLTDPVRQQLAASAPMAVQRALFDSVLTQKWSARALSLMPGRREPGWMVVPLGNPLDALELAMVMSSPLWCLSQPVAVEALTQQVMAREGCGVLWVVDAMPTAAQRDKWLPSEPLPFPAAAWGPLASRLMPETMILNGLRGQLASQLPTLGDGMNHRQTERFA